MAVAADLREVVDGVGLGSESGDVGNRDADGAGGAALGRAEAGVADEDVFPAEGGEGVAGDEVGGEGGEGDEAAIGAHGLVVGAGVGDGAVVADGDQAGGGRAACRRAKTGVAQVNLALAVDVLGDEVGGVGGVGDESAVGADGGDDLEIERGVGLRAAGGDILAGGAGNAGGRRTDAGVAQVDVVVDGSIVGDEVGGVGCEGNEPASGVDGLAFVVLVGLVAIRRLRD